MTIAAPPPPVDFGDQDLDFSDVEQSEMGAEVVGQPRPKRKSRSMLRVPADQVARVDEKPQSVEPAPSVADTLVEHAFSNGGTADAVVPSLLTLEADPPTPQHSDPDSDPSDVAAGSQEDDEDVEVEDATSDESPFRDEREVKVARPAMAALVRAVMTPKPAQPDGDVAEVAPSVLDAIDTPVFSSAPSPRPSANVVEVTAALGSLGGVELSPVARALVQAVIPAVPQGIPAPVAMDVKSGPVALVAEAWPAPGATPEAWPAPGATPEAEAKPVDGDEVEAEAKPVDGDEVEAEAKPVDGDEVEVEADADAVPEADELEPESAETKPADADEELDSAELEEAESSGPVAVVATPKAPPLPPGPPPSPTAQTSPTAPSPSNGSGVAPPPSPSVPPSPPPAPAAALPPPNGNAPSLTPPVPPPPPAARPAPPELRTRKKKRTKQWFEEIFDEDYLRTLPSLTQRQTERESQFIVDSLDLPPGASVLDLGCGHGRHALDLAPRGLQVTGLDSSLPLLIRAADGARANSVNVNFVHGDMREMTFNEEFDGAYCMFTTFGYFDDDTNRKVAANLAQALKPGGRLLLDVINRDYLVRDLPTRVWWQGEGCVVLEEVDFNYFSSRLQVQRQIIFEDGRQFEQEISIRAYSLHEIGKILHHSGFRVTEVSGGLALKGTFFGALSRQILVTAEKKTTP